MNFLRKQVDKIKPHFEEGGKFEKLHSVFDGFETFLLVPNSTSKSGTHIHDCVDAKRTMIIVVMALMPALLLGMFNIGYQHFLAIGQAASFWEQFFFGALAVLPKIIISYVIGLGIEFVFAQIKKEEIQEGFLVSGMLIPMIMPIETPLWMIAVATAFAVVFAKEVFGGTGFNIFNVALITRAFLFFAYPSKMSGDEVFVRTGDTFGLGGGNLIDGFSGATPLGDIATATTQQVQLTAVDGSVIGLWEMFIGLIPGSIGETSVLAILLGAAVLLITGIASWKIMLSVFAGGAVMAFIFNIFGVNASMSLSPLEHLMLGGFAFGAVFMATDPVTGARTEKGKWIYGFLIGIFGILIRVLNPGYPEGMMLAILLLNMFAPLIDHYVVEGNTKRRMKRMKSSTI